MKPDGVITRGTTNPNRLRRVDRWIAYRCGAALAGAADPLVVDLGYGATPVTAVELRARLAASVRADVRVVGLEIDPARVTDAQPYADPPGLTFARGGFELAGLRPVVVRAFNVLRQYDESAVADAWSRMAAAAGFVVEGTCDESGRLSSWVLLERGDSASALPRGGSPVSLTLAAKLSTLDRPSTLAERLPKALIHHNVPGERVHGLMSALDSAWDAAAGYATFGVRQRWIRTCEAVRAAGWPVLDRSTRWRLGELTVAWDSVS